MSTLEERIASLEQEIADYRAAWINAVASEDKRSLQDLIKSCREII
jgi:uncharacterized small protein (DUF1192 family)